jgi:hypothetical protein
MKRCRILLGPFRGTEVFLDVGTSRRKLLGLYEYVLNDWFAEKVPLHKTFFDVGANNGYHTYGFAWLAKRSGNPNPKIIAVEPEVTCELTEPMKWKKYVGCDISIVEKFCGDGANTNGITLDSLLKKSEGGLVKVDIEGAEALMFEGCEELPSNPNYDWCIEIHGEDTIPRVVAPFEATGRPFEIRELKPIPILGAEKRNVVTKWLTTI